jgi:hypothetical protein
MSIPLGIRSHTPHKTPKMHTPKFLQTNNGPPSSRAPRRSPSKPSKNQSTPNWPCTRSFAIQRGNNNSPKNIILQLVTLFPVYLRAFPLFEHSPKNTIPQNQFKFPPNPQNSAHSHSPIIKGPLADLILLVTRFIVTHILIYSFIQDPFSHKFLKLS